MSTSAPLICLPPAGAGPSVFRSWQRQDKAIIAPQIPGREARFRDSLPSSLEELADGLAAELYPNLPTDYALFGYSMGGTLALLLAQRFIEMGGPSPLRLFVLGAQGPDRLHEGTSEIATLDENAFWSEIARIGGTPIEVISDPDLRQLFETPLRADFRICSTYRHNPELPALPCEIHAFVAQDDHLVEPDSIESWAKQSRTKAQLHRIPGRHMLTEDEFMALHRQVRSLMLPNRHAASLAPLSTL
ncbi:MAG: alpha/beta fold hydrolase [Pseudomonadota bacterium]